MREHLKEVTGSELAQATIITLYVIAVLSIITIISNL